ncbi:ATP-binding protein [Agrobacterium deltaense]|uniref:ATP-binding protein n=1 Tax=Agrobacterium deltaense TaxID=1183412 RepID=UPI003D97F502
MFGDFPFLYNIKPQDRIVERFRTIERRTIRAYWLSASIIIAIATLGAATIVYRDYRGRLDDAGQHVMYLAQALAEHTTQIFVKLDALSRAVIEDSTDRIVDENLLSEVMRRRAAAEPAAMGIAIIDREGKVRVSGMDAYPVGKEMSATTEFQVLRRTGAPQFYISQPDRSDLNVPGEFRDWTMSYARRIEGAGGDFNGYVLIVIEEAYLYGFYNRLEEQPGMVLGLVGEDGVIRASNVREVIGRNVESYIRAQIAAGEGIKISPSVRTGIERIFAYYRSSAAPLLAYVGIPVAPIYKAWMIASSVIVAALAALFAALVALGIVLGRYMRNRDSLVRSMVEAAQERREKEFLETIVNTGAVLMAVADPQGRCVVANQAMRQMFPHLNLDVSASGAVSRVLGEPWDVILAQLPWQDVREITLDNGTKRALSWSVSPILDKENAIKNLVAVGLDITDRRQAELAIYQSAKLVTLGEMTTGIAHEINQPLATLAMGLDNLSAHIATGNLAPAAIAASLTLLSDQVDRAANIVRHMRIYGHRGGGALRPLDPAEAIDGALAIARGPIEAEGIQILGDYSRGEFEVIADMLLVEQIILNLVLNARDAILEKDGSFVADRERILIQLEAQEEGMLAISVSDTGVGIPPVILDRLFEPFFSTKPVGKGTGLGLSLGHGMARDMGGRLEVRNVAEGAEFRLILRQDEPTRDRGAA